MRARDQMATIIFRVLIGAIGLSLLSFFVVNGVDSLVDWFSIATVLSVFLGYAFGGDKLARRLVRIRSDEDDR